MNAKDLTLNIAVNMGRLSRWVADEKLSRVPSFMRETEDYLQELDRVPKAEKFKATYEKFKKRFEFLKQSSKLDDVWAEEALTWANILTHRAKLA